jgi:hypothetical protein
MPNQLTMTNKLSPDFCKRKSAVQTFEPDRVVIFN